MKKDYLVWAFKGMAMGAADAVPGVSGGTIALILGIYERFIGALASFKPSLWQYLKNKDFKGLWKAIDGAFLLCLGSGIIISLISVLNIMHWLLVVAAPVVWAFFMGLILVSLWQLSVGRVWQVKDGLLLFVGLLISVLFATATGVTLQVSPLTLIFGGALAISAMLLPGISGSFMLLLLGLYPVVVNAVHDRNVIIVLWVALGCIIGMVTFSRFLQWLLSRWHERVMSFMLGFIVGALVKLWPWQFNGQWYFPDQYSLVTGSNHWLGVSVLAALLGGVTVYFLHKPTS